MISSSSDNRDDLHSDMLEIESNSQAIDVSGAKLEVKAQLDAILASLRLANPQPPNVGENLDISSIEEIRANISTTEPVTHTEELIQELNAAREQLTLARTELQLLQQRNQLQVELVDANTQQVKLLKLHTQQLAKHSKERVETTRELLGDLFQVRTDIVTNLAKFGSYQEIATLLGQLESARQELVVAHDALNETLRDRATILREQIGTTSQTLETKIDLIERSFGELSESVSNEKEQFYALTVETIEKADAIGAQLAQIVQQMNSDRVKISRIEADILDLRQSNSQADERQSTNFDVRDRELMLLTNNFQADRKKQLVTTKKFSTWLWLLSMVVGMMSIASIRMLLLLK